MLRNPKCTLAINNNRVNVTPTGVEHNLHCGRYRMNDDCVYFHTQVNIRREYIVLSTTHIANWRFYGPDGPGTHRTEKFDKNKKASLLNRSLLAVDRDSFSNHQNKFASQGYAYSGLK